MKLLIKGGQVIDPANNREGAFDLLIEDSGSGAGISAIEKRGGFKDLKDCEIIDAKGLLVVPGLIDLHVHLREPGFEWKETIESGAKAALSGGFTTVCCMPNTRPTNDSAEITKFIVERSKALMEQGAATSRVLPIGAVSIGLKGIEMAPFSEMHKSGCVAFSDDGEPVFNAGLMRRALEWCSMLGVPICCHEEDKCLSCGGSMNESYLSSRLGLKGWPKIAEEVMIARDIELCRDTGSRVHICHVSTARGVELLRRAKNDGIPITAEVTPHHLLLTEDRVADYDTNAKMSPPLRSAEDCEALIEGLNDGTIDAIASDHAPHERETKEVEFDAASFGIIGLQSSLPLMLELVRKERCSISKIIGALTSGPAAAFNFADRGRFSVGCLADLVLVDPEQSWNFDSSEIQSISKNTPFLGRKMKGRVKQVIVDGKIFSP